MEDSHNADPVRDLNNFLQGQPGGNMTKEFKWNWSREGPEHDALYHVTAICKYSLCNRASSSFVQHLYNSPGSEHWGGTWPFEKGWETDSICASLGILEVIW